MIFELFLTHLKKEIAVEWLNRFFEEKNDTNSKKDTFRTNFSLHWNIFSKSFEILLKSF